MDLGGLWRAARSDDNLLRVMADPGFDDAGWSAVPVPGHWRCHPEFAGSDGPLCYRRRFETALPEPGRRTFLTFDGIFYQSDVWLDGEYLGDTEGYFFPHTLEVTAAAARATTHVLAVEVACNRPADLKAKRNLTGVFQHWDCIDPDWNPGGIWAGVHLDETGPVRIRWLKTLCREASSDRATLELEAELDAARPLEAQVDTLVRRERAATATVAHAQSHALAQGVNRVRWTVAVEHPDLWWPRALGDQPLYDVAVTVATSGEMSDRREVTTGLRRVQIRNFIATVNGERLFLKGVNYGPADRALANPDVARIAGDVQLACDAGLDLMRVHAHVARPELYEAADRAGMLLWQDLPLQWGYGQVRRQAVAQARQAVTLLGHHPSIALWCGHNEPMAVDMEPGSALEPRTVARVIRAQVLPSWNKTALDRSVRRALERADGTREVVAHSGVLPHPAWGTDSHFYFGWYHGEERDLPAVMARLPVLARFVSEFGAQAVPETDEFLHPEKWPDLDWDLLEAHHSMQRSIFERRVPPGRYPSFDAWRKATQHYQATVLRFHVEALRRLKYRPAGGFCAFMLADAQPAVSWSVLDHERVPKLGYSALAKACAPVIVTADRLAAGYRGGEVVSVDVHAISDLRAPLESGLVTAVLRWPDGERTWRFAGEIPADACTRIGRISHTLPDALDPGEVALELTLEWAGGAVSSSYEGRVL